MIRKMASLIIQIMELNKNKHKSYVYKMAEVPRLLTNDEIESILSRLAPPQIMSSELREHVHKEIKIKYKYQLELIKLKPSKIDKLGDYIANKSKRSFYQPGAPIGFNVSESVSQPATQLVLNTFHSAGQAMQNGFGRFKSNIKLRPYKKHSEEFNMHIHMNDKNYSYEDLYIKAHQFVSVTMSELLDTSRIIKEEYPFEDMDIYTPEFKKLNSYEDEGYAFRLRFNREKLFLHRITLENIAAELMNIGGEYFTLFFGPQDMGIIDIYPKESAVCTGENRNLKECSNLFQNGFLKNKMRTVKLGEYTSISDATIKKIEVINIIKDVTNHYEDSEVSSNLVRVWINWVYAKKEGVPTSKLESLLEITGYPIKGYDSSGNYYIVESDTLDIKKDIKNKLKEEDKKLIEKYKDTLRLETTDLFRHGYYNCIMTKGTELAKVRVHNEVDEFNTISDNVLEINDVLGLEVARNYLEKEIYDLFEQNDQIIAPRNISIMVDWMTANIRPISVNPKNILKSDTSVSRGMCFEYPQISIVKGSVLSTEEPLSNVSARLLFGSKQKLGTGAFDIIEDPEVVNLYYNINNESDPGSLRLTSSALDRMSRRRQQSPLARASTESNFSRESEIAFQT